MKCQSCGVDFSAFNRRVIYFNLIVHALIIVHGEILVH
jgi:hypothetical protein